MKLLLNIILTAIAVAIAAYLLPGVVLASFWTAVIVAIVLGIINIFIRPLVLLLTLPINILTLGLLTFVINAAMILLADSLVSGFAVGGFWSALLFSIIVAVLKMLFSSFENKA